MTKITAVQNHENITVITGAHIDSIAGMPGQYDATISQNGSTETHRIGSVVMAIGWKPYDANKLEHLGYGKFKNVVTNVEVEEMAAANNGSHQQAFRRPEGQAGGIPAVRRTA